jgi:hypothetical protein
MNIKLPTRPTAWACRTCNKVDWADTKEQLAKPEHVAHRGVDIGTCKGQMIPLYDEASLRQANDKLTDAGGESKKD